MKQSKEEIEYLKDAFKNGAEIQFKKSINGWLKLHDPSWRKYSTYRINPECGYAKNGMYKEFSKDMLEENDVIKLRNENLYIVNNYKGVMIGRSEWSLHSLGGDYCSDMKWSSSSNLDIIAVYRPTEQRQLLESNWGKMPCIWERQEEVKVEELTIGDIEEKLGYKIKVVK